MLKFEVGKTYADRGWKFLVMDRTEASVTLADVNTGDLKTCRINHLWSKNRNAETVLPLGGYSYAPAVSADMIWRGEMIVPKVYYHPDGAFDNFPGIVGGAMVKLAKAGRVNDGKILYNRCIPYVDNMDLVKVIAADYVELVKCDSDDEVRAFPVV